MKVDSLKKTARGRIKHAVSTEAKYPLFSGIVASLEKRERETLVGKTGPFEMYSPEWYADRIIRKIEKTRFLLAEGEADRAAMEAYSLARFIYWQGDAINKNFKQENKNILAGATTRVANQKRGKKRGEVISAAKQPEHKSWREEAEKVWKKNPGASKSNVAGIVKTRLKSSAAVRTIRAVI